MAKYFTKINDRFGKLVVVSEIYHRFNGRQNERVVDLQCDCTNKITARVDGLFLRKLKSCGCFRSICKSKYNPKIGDKINFWTIISEKYKIPNGRWQKTVLDVECICGNKRSLSPGTIFGNHTVSCGCEGLKNRVQANTKHNFAGSRLYMIWAHMIQRCINPKTKKFHNYGGRNIQVCDEWHSPEIFIEWALNNGYEDNLSIDRIDVNGNYEPNNCRWATSKEQTRNMRRNRFYTFLGETKCLRDWQNDPRCPVSRTSLRYRLDTLNMTFEEAFTTPRLK